MARDEHWSDADNQRSVIGLRHKVFVAAFLILVSCSPSSPPGATAQNASGVVPTRSLLAPEYVQVDRGVYLAPFSSNQAQAIFAGELDAEFYPDHGTLKCRTRKKDSPFDTGGLISVVDTATSILFYGPCFHIGRVAVGLSRDTIEHLLGVSDRTMPGSGGIETRVYFVEREQSAPTYFVIGYPNDQAVSVQFTGSPSLRNDYTLSTLALGDPMDRALKRLGPPAGRCPVAEIDGEVWSYSPFLLSIEIKSDRIFSMRVAEPSRPTATARPQGDPSMHVQSGGGLQAGGDRKSLEEIAAAVAKLPEGVVAERAVTADIGWPRHPTEFEALGRNAVLHVSAVSQDPKELPLMRVFVRGRDAATIPLSKIGPSKIRPTEPGSDINRLLGPHREDAFYLLPIATTTCLGGIGVDFAQGRTDFDVVRLPLSAPPSAQGSRVSREPQYEALRAFIEREWPAIPLPEELKRQAEGPTSTAFRTSMVGASSRSDSHAADSAMLMPPPYPPPQAGEGFQ
jgi:hypothetical protein